VAKTKESKKGSKKEQFIEDPLSRDLALYLCQVPVVMLKTFEIERARKYLYYLFGSGDSGLLKEGYEVYSYDCDLGVARLTENESTKKVKKVADKGKSLKQFQEFFEAKIEKVLEKDQDDIDGDKIIYIISIDKSMISIPIVKQKLINNWDALRSRMIKIILLSVDGYLPPELERAVPLVKFSLPSSDVLSRAIKIDLERMLSKRGMKDKAFKTFMEKLIKDENFVKVVGDSCKGLTVDEALLALAGSLFDSYNEAKNNPDDLDVNRLIVSNVNKSKRNLIEKSGILEFIEVDGDLDQLGGAGNLKEYLLNRKDEFTDPGYVKKYNLQPPRGILNVGLPGTGKSWSAKLVGNEFGVPIVRLDVGKLFHKHVGESEGRARSALETLDAIGKVIVWIDEIEKATSGMRSSGQTDSGVTDRVMSTILTWMNEKTSMVFIMATANDITKLPPEFLRKGRFDEIFFFDLPTSNERKNIFEIHLKLLLTNFYDDLELDYYDINSLAVASEGFTGAEIRSVIEDSMHVAAKIHKEYSNGREKYPSTDDILLAISKTRPLSQASSDQISRLRRWAEGAAVNVSDDDGKSNTVESKLCSYTICPYRGLDPKTAMALIGNSDVLAIREIFDMLKEQLKGGYEDEPNH